jgi:hypothetical protein
MSHLPADLVLQLIKPDGPLLTEFESLSVRESLRECSFSEGTTREIRYTFGPTDLKNHYLLKIFDKPLF